MYSTNPARPRSRSRLPTRRKAVFELDTTYTQDLSLFSPTPAPSSFHSRFETDFNNRRHLPLRDSTLLPSRATALLRRCASLHTALGHFAAVVEPLRIIKAENITEGHVVDVCFEAERLGRAFSELEGQLEEVKGMLEDLRERKGRRL